MSLATIIEIAFSEKFRVALDSKIWQYDNVEMDLKYVQRVCFEKLSISFRFTRSNHLIVLRRKRRNKTKKKKRSSEGENIISEE